MASYAETLLAPGEVVVHRSRQHWLSLILDSRLAIVLWAIVIGALIVSWIGRFDGLIAQGLLALEGIALVGGILVVLWRWWHWRTEEYLITNRRLLKVSGIINKRSGDSSLEKINDAILEENLIGRMLNYGDLDILTAADIAVDRYRMLDKAKDFKKKMLEAKHNLESGVGFAEVNRQPMAPAMAFQSAPVQPVSPLAPPPAAAVAAAPAPLADPIDTPEEVTAALARLAELRDKGAITSGEYEVKKRELLGRL
jgi:hypothetical protein